MKRPAMRWIVASVILGVASVALAAGVLVESYSSAFVFGYTTSGVHGLSKSYQVKNLDCVAELDPPTATEVPSTVGNLFDVLSASYPDPPWSYATAVVPLSQGSLVVKTYDVEGRPVAVGAEFHVNYVPGIGDPAGVHWIQVVTNNHAITGTHGTPDNKVDFPLPEPPYVRTTPYYDEKGSANATAFYDFPERPDADKDHTWQADLFLVTGTRSGGRRT